MKRANQAELENLYRCMIIHSFMHSYSYSSESLFLTMQGANGDPGLPGEAGEPGQTGLPGKPVCILIFTKI